MKQSLFDPHRMDISNNLILIPRFWDAVYFDQLKNDAIGDMKILNTDILLFNNYAAVVGFIGYPHILTVLEFVANVREKNIYFLGTAGSMNEDICKPMPLQVAEINSSTVFNCFDQSEAFKLKTFDNPDFRKAKGVTVDLVQRETKEWLNEQKQRKMDFVEMEIYPLRVYLENPFHAVVVTSDILRETGVDVFTEKALLRQEFVKSFEYIVNSMESTD